MNESDRREAVDEYVERLERALDEVPPGERRDLVAEVRTHIDEAWESAPEHNRATLLGILDRLGDPETLAEEYRERLGREAPPEREGPDLLSIAAVVLTWLIWPVGLLLAWLSPRWSVRDKLVATALPISGLLLVLSLVVPVTVVTQGGPPDPVIEVETRVSDAAATPVATVERAPATSTQVVESAPERLIATVLLLYGLWGASFLAAVFLALRRKPRPHTGAYVVPALAAIVTIGGVAAMLALVAVGA